MISMGVTEGTSFQLCELQEGTALFILGGKRLNKQVDKGKTLLVNGPASVIVVSGKVVVFGFQIRNGHKLVVREGKRLPFRVDEIATFQISIGQAGAVEEVEGSTIPASWAEAFEMARCLQHKPVVVMVIGGVDSGKSSFCTYLINRLVAEKCSVSVLDEDVGQSDIGPPCTIAYANVVKPVTDLFNLEYENAFFVGAVSPSDASDRTIEGASVLMKEILSRDPVDFVVVNTDGWAEGEDAVGFKSYLANVIKPDVVFCLDRPDGLPSLCATFGDSLGEFREERAESPLAISQRDREKRRNLRELGYIKYLEGAKLKSFSLKRLKVSECCGASQISNTKTKFALRLSEERGLLVGLHDSQGKFLGIGTLQGVDALRQTLKVRTSVQAEPIAIVLGKVRLDANFHEFYPLTGKTPT